MLLETIGSAKRALVLGAGGQNDVLGVAAYADLLRSLNVETFFAEIPWARPRQGQPLGPTRVEEIATTGKVRRDWCELLPLSVLATSHPSARVAATLGGRAFACSLIRGVVGLAAAVREICGEAACDLIILSDSGGDILGTGLEAGALSPLLEACSLAAVRSLGVRGVVAVVGVGADGELRADEYQDGLVQAYASGAVLGAWAIGPRGVELALDWTDEFPSDASRLPFLAASGTFGKVAIRGGRRTAELSALTALTWFLDLGFVFERNQFARDLESVSSLNAAGDVLEAHGRLSEWNFLQLCKRRTELGLSLPPGP